MTVLLEIERIEVAIGALRLLDGISLTVDRGKILGLVGESGSGKSLTAMAALGLLPLIGGRVTGGAVARGGKRADPVAPPVAEHAGTCAGFGDARHGGRHHP